MEPILSGLVIRSPATLTPNSQLSSSVDQVSVVTPVGDRSLINPNHRVLYIISLPQNIMLVFISYMSPLLELNFADIDVDLTVVDLILPAPPAPST